VDAEDVDLERVPPGLDVVRPRRLAVAKAGVRDEQVDRSERRLDVAHHRLDVFLLRHVGRDREAADLAGDRFDLVARPRAHGDARAG
jgi:hypothetical protein